MTITGARIRLILGPRTPPVVGPGAPGFFQLGINTSGLESGNKYPSLDTLRWRALHGMPFIRQPVGWNTMQPVLGGPVPTGPGTEFAKLSRVLGYEAQLRMTVLVDVHANGRYDGIGSSKATLVTDTAPSAYGPATPVTTD